MYTWTHKEHRSTGEVSSFSGPLMWTDRLSSGTSLATGTIPEVPYGATLMHPGRPGSGRPYSL